MTTPTKEQIKIILNVVKNYLLQSGNIFAWKWEDVVLIVITEWEKIKGDAVLSWLETEYGYSKGRLLDSRKKSNTDTEQKLMFALQCLISTRKNQK